VSGVNQHLTRMSWLGMMIALNLINQMRGTMLNKIRRLFVIKTSLEAYLIIYALGLGAVERGSIYLTRFPGFGGKLLFIACTGAVFMAGAKILDCLKHEQRLTDKSKV
jgi:hypothetical protein